MGKVVNRRLANKAQWGLQDVVAAAMDGRREVDAAMGLAAERMDPLLLLRLGRIADCLFFVERQARNALNGEYDERGRPEWMNGRGQ